MFHPSSAKPIAVRMRHSSSYPDERIPITSSLPVEPPRLSPPETFGSPVTYFCAERNLDVCPSCYSKFSSHLKSILNLTPCYSWEQRGFRPSDVQCDACQNRFEDVSESKVSVAIKLRGVLGNIDDIIRATTSFASTMNFQQMHAALCLGGFSAEEANKLIEGWSNARARGYCAETLGHK